MERLEPIAIVGMACRLPGAADLPGYWRLLRGGVDAIREVPSDRWDLGEFYDADAARPGKMTTRWGGFLERVDSFDPSFFGISPREAAYMDPQQRLLLEVAWEALEEGGLVPESLAGTPVGVFVGVSTYDYGAFQLTSPGGIADGYANTGSALSIAANRISYVFDFRGPSLSIDTACSSSLAAANLACQSLWRGESTLALAGGVNVILSPTITIGFSKLKAMAADGRCKTFDARADGYVRGEGAAIVVLKPLAHALRDGDRIHALIRGSAMNQDGRTNGLTAPNGLSQEALVRHALAQAGVAPAQVGYVEAHGTGTALGDPIEMNALGAALAPGRPPGRRCAVGSVKTNIGHLEAAAGIAGLVKVALALEHREIPPSLHFEAPNPHIPFDALPLAVQGTLAPWPEDLRPAIAGVSSFGFGGTNVHMVLEEPPAPRPAGRDELAGEDRPWLMALSARSPDALRAVAEGLAESLNQTSAPALPDVAYTLARRRAHHEHRLVAVARSNAELREHLQAFLAGEARAGLSSGRALRGRRRKLAFVFPGQGSQWFGMARGLLAREPVFRDALERCADAIRRQVDWSLLDELQADAERSQLASVDRIQPALWAIQVGLAALWRSWGVTPDAVVGHSMGEVAAAHVAGALSLDHAAAVICRRSRLLRRTSGQGAMAAVELSIEEAGRALAGYEDRVSIAVSNSPSSTVLSGDVAALEEILRTLEARGVFCRRVKVDVASHSPQMEPLRADLLAALEDVRSTPPAVPLYSTVTGEVSGTLPLEATYWVRNLRDPVLFSRAVRRLLDGAHTVFLELSPHPILLAAVQQTLQHAGKEGTVLPSLRREEDEQVVMLGSLGALWNVGRAIDWNAVTPATGRLASLPAYAWQRERFWLEPEESRPAAARERAGHPLLGAHLQSAAQATHFWDMEPGTQALPYLADHRVEGAIVLPAACYLETALAAAREAFGPGAHAIEDVEFARALVLDNERPSALQLAMSPGMPGLASFQFLGRAASAPAVMHASGTVRLAAGAPGEAASTLEQIQARCLEGESAEDHYRRARENGLDYGPGFQGVERLWRREGEALGRLRLAEGLRRQAASYRVHPALLDACFQVLAAALPRGANGSGSGAPYLPVALDRLQLAGEGVPEGELWGHAVWREIAGDARHVGGDVFLRDAAGGVLLAAQGLLLQRLEGRADARAARDEWFYELRWEQAVRPRAQAAPGTPGTWLLFPDRGGVGAALQRRLEEIGDTCLVVPPGTGAEALRVLLAGHAACRGIVHLASLDVAPLDEERPVLGALAAAVDLGCGTVVQLVQALAGATFRTAPRLWLVTAAAQAVRTGDPVAVPQAPLWGLARTIRHEHPELRCTSVDLATGAAGEAAALFDEIAQGDREEQVALRGGERHVARLVRASPESTQTPGASAGEEALAPADGRPFRLEVTAPGTLDGLRLRATEEAAPGPGEVELDVAAAGLNFRDVLLALGLLPALPDGSIPLGFECAGTVRAVGEGVSGLAPGDEVVAIAAHSLATRVVTPGAFVLPKPRDLDFEQAATLPVAFLTAHYALRHLGRVAAGERVLIHSASGGVGLAAIQVALRAGADVFVTAGSAEKRDFLRSLGLRHVMDSRSLAFASEVLAATQGEGVDLVLNSLPGEALTRSLSLLRSGGRFLELGKRDVLQNNPLGLQLLERNRSFFAIDLHAMSREQPVLFGSLLAETMRSLREDGLRPLPHRTFAVSEAEGALRHLAQGRHIGKVVVTLRGAPVQIAAAPSRPAALRADGTYLITGGLGGLGLAVARRMVEEGARHLALLGRRGLSAEAEPVIDQMRQAGARIAVVHADVSDAPALRRALGEVERDHPPLRGVVHAAGRLDDATVVQLDAARLASVMEPKAAGAWNLHALTADRALDFFVLFSSAASVLGSPGQGNYAAANAFLDALAHHRRARGLPALSVNWGPWSEVGLAAHPDRGGRLATAGIDSLTPAQGVAAFLRVLRADTAQLAVIPVDWRAWRESAPAMAEVPLVAALFREAGGVASPAAPGLAAALRAAAPGDRRALLEAHLQQQVARVLRLPASRLDVQRPLSTLGIDSLMAVELKNRIEGDLQVSLPLIQVIQGPSVAELAGLLLAQMDGGEGSIAPPADRAEPPRAKGDSLLLSLLSLADDEPHA